MKRLIRLFFVLLLLSLLSGCAYYSKMAAPVEPGQQNKYEILDHIKTSVTGTRFLTIPINIPSSTQIIKDEVNRLGGDGIINLEITFSEFNFFLFSFPIVEVEGDVVKIADQLINYSRYQEAQSDQSIDTSKVQKGQSGELIDAPKVYNVPVDPEEFQKWKDKLLRSIKKSDYYWSWKSFEKRNAIKVSREKWVESLPESEYQEYLSSGESFNKWLVKRLKK